MKVAAVLLAFAISAGAYADTISETLTLDTSTLAPSGSPYSLELLLTGGSGNTVTFSNFDLGGGTANFNMPAPAGVVVTTAPAKVTLTDATGGSGNFGPEYDLSFTPGTRLSFSVTSSNLGPQTGSSPDEVMISLADTTGVLLTTTDPAGSDALYRLLLTGAADVPALYSGTASGFNDSFVLSAGPGNGGGAGGNPGGGGGNPGGGGGGSVGGVPEPSTFGLAFLGFLGCVPLIGRRIAQGKS